MSRAVLPTGIEIEYEAIGSPDDPTVLLVMGFTAQLIAWPDDFCAMIAGAGFHVVRFDNRDCGLSTKHDGVEVDMGGVLTAALGGQPDQMPPVPYTLSDMAADAIGVLDDLAVERAHVVGASMGGMIAQTMAIEHPGRLASLTSIMSMTGEPEYGSPMPEAAGVLLAPPPEGRDDYIAHAANYAVWQSKRHFDLDEAQTAAAAAYDRSFYPQGANRQLAAIYASGSRADGLAQVTTPTLVIHGRDDTLIPPSGGQRTVDLVPGASLVLLADMGHDLPRPLWPTVVGALTAHFRLADT